jgi:hypothetical protein
MASAVAIVGKYVGLKPNDPVGPLPVGLLMKGLGPRSGYGQSVFACAVAESIAGGLAGDSHPLSAEDSF